MRVLIAAMLVLATFAFVPSAEATGDCVGKPDQVQACQSVEDGRACAGVGFGLQGARVCASEAGASVCIGINCYVIEFQ